MDITLVLALWGAVLSTLLAIRGWWRNRTRVLVVFANNMRASDSDNCWKWICLEVSISNQSDKALSVTGYGLTFTELDSERHYLSRAISYAVNERGDTVLEDSPTGDLNAIDANLTFLDSPQNIAPRYSVFGWVGFYFEEPVPRHVVEAGRLTFALVDQDGKDLVYEVVGLGGSEPSRLVEERRRNRLSKFLP